MVDDLEDGWNRSDVSDPKTRAEVSEILTRFKQQLPAPTRELALELVRACGFSFRGQSERVDIYKSPLLPSKPITINRGSRLHEGMAKAIIGTVERLLANLPEGETNG